MTLSIIHNSCKFPFKSSFPQYITQFREMYEEVAEPPPNTYAVEVTTQQLYLYHQNDDFKIVARSKITHHTKLWKSPWWSIPDTYYDCFIVKLYCKNNPSDTPYWKLLYAN